MTKAERTAAMAPAHTASIVRRRKAEALLAAAEQLLRDEKSVEVPRGEN
jgi:hypothetical protein